MLHDQERQGRVVNSLLRKNVEYYYDAISEYGHVNCSAYAMGLEFRTVLVIGDEHELEYWHIDDIDGVCFDYPAIQN